jgi:DtxR family Mn-dependent transcriptional regulator
MTRGTKHHTNHRGAGGIDERAEELLEEIWTVLEENGQDRADPLPPIPVASLREEERGEVGQLERAGLATTPSAETVQLTPDGRAAATDIIRRHRLAERLVADVLDLHGDEMEPYACRFEHLVHPGLEERICTLLGHPRVCPHDKPIPRGPCCREDRHEIGPVVVKLHELHPGQRGTIAYLHSEDQSRLSKLLAMGVLPGAEIELQRRIPTFVFRVGFSQFAVDESVADSVFVRLEG